MEALEKCYIYAKNTSNMDFLASTVAFLEFQGREVNALNVAGNMPREQSDSFFERLNYYRAIYKKQTEPA
ncbi:glycogen synthesis protein [Serratia sp. UGAL515B_01]|uniref:glycogen synthesis protein n=1 Tax=Serratia sp. UGAL515B_01 TaxID=2986763 RepID=UPI0029545524|nr:glycogen synthesis protein [Serratia sp. UGAL515B_01]WON75732.1 glycogen synthesis protein [Serratia sp. UGAL515B_01]